MSKIIPHIYKDKLPKELLYPVKYSDIELCFLGRSTNDVNLKVFFHPYQNYWKEERERLEFEGYYKIITFSNTPVAPQIRRDVEDPNAIWIRIYAVTHNVVNTSELNRVMLRELLVEQIHKLTPNGLPCDRWHFEVTLMAKAGLLECVSQEWTGMRQKPKTRLLISANKTKQNLGFGVN